MNGSLVAIARGVPPTIGSCLLTHIDRTEISYALACKQHDEYLNALRALGVRIVELEPLLDYPDSCFVEDTAVVLDEVAVIAPMGSISRRGEQRSVAERLAQFRRIVFLGTTERLDGGDVLRIGRTLFVGDSRRTDRETVNGFEDIVRSHGYRVEPVKVRGCLHLKTACTAISGNAVIANSEWIDVSAFKGMEVINVPAAEEWAANVVRIGEAVIVANGKNATVELIMKRGIDVRQVDISEFQKAEAGLTCLSIIFSEYSS